jgi:hypothetical protein
VAPPPRRPGRRLSLPHRGAEKREPESARIARFERDLRNLAHLRQFALPIVDALAEWPERATWGEWIELFGAGARALRGRRACCRRWRSAADGGVGR